ncbi:hypothetical protein PV761_03435 [Arthrobacter sp. CC3]|uniref:DUF7432 family protein n=1 Tax=Arthrobacter sp. CC3 TaxID=3029185 RepID=UPI0032655240
MTRPTSPADLEDYQTRGHRVATIPSDYITRYPSLGQHLLAALAEAGRLGLAIEDGEIVIPLTETELDNKLQSAQRSWDAGKELHDKYLADGEWPKYSYVWGSYLTAEGIATPEKPEHVS